MDSHWKVEGSPKCVESPLTSVGWTHAQLFFKLLLAPTLLNFAHEFNLLDQLITGCLVSSLITLCIINNFLLVKKNMVRDIQGILERIEMPTY